MPLDVQMGNGGYGVPGGADVSHDGTGREPSSGLNLDRNAREVPGVEHIPPGRYVCDREAARIDVGSWYVLVHAIHTDYGGIGDRKNRGSIGRDHVSADVYTSIGTGGTPGIGKRRIPEWADEGGP